MEHKMLDLGNGPVVNEQIDEDKMAESLAYEAITSFWNIRKGSVVTAQEYSAKILGYVNYKLARNIAIVAAQCISLLAVAICSAYFKAETAEGLPPYVHGLFFGIVIVSVLPMPFTYFKVLEAISTRNYVISVARRQGYIAHSLKEHIDAGRIRVLLAVKSMTPSPSKH